MLKPSITSKFFERIVTSQTGVQYRVVFLVTFVGGEVKAKIISAEAISTVLCLPCATSKISHLTSYFAPFSFEVSPFTSLLFFTSQPTRAPSFN